MKRTPKTLLVTMILALAASSLSAATLKYTSVMRLGAYIPKTLATTIHEEGVAIDAYAYTFSYSVKQVADTRVLYVVAL